MNDRERLIELIDDALAVYDVIVYARLNADEIADHLIANGVTVQKHGRWGKCFEDWRQQIEGDKCSVCGFEHYGCGIKHYHYCPNCGARMNLEDN